MKGSARASLLAGLAAASSHPAAVLTRGHVEALLWAVGLMAAYALVTLVSPTKRCACRKPGRARPRNCRRCKGRGRHPRPGAAAVHKFAWSVLLGRLMERRRDHIADALADRDDG